MGTGDYPNIFETEPAEIRYEDERGVCDLVVVRDSPEPGTCRPFILGKIFPAPTVEKSMVGVARIQLRVIIIFGTGRRY